MSISSVNGHATHGSVSMCVSVVSKATRLRSPSSVKRLHFRRQNVASVSLDRKRSCDSREFFDWRVSSFKSDDPSILERAKGSSLGDQGMDSVHLVRKRSCGFRQCLDVRAGSPKSDESWFSRDDPRSPFAESRGR